MNGTKINERGKTAVRFEINDGRFGSFLIDRSKIVSSAQEAYGKDGNILKSISKNPERFLNSESFKVMLEESRRHRQENLKTLYPKQLYYL